MLEELLGHRDPSCRQLRVPGRELLDAGREVVRRDDFGDQTEGARLIGAQAPVRDHPLERLRVSEQPVYEPRPAGVGNEPDPDEPRNEGRRVGGDPDVARTGEREPRTGDGAVDRGDDRLFERADRPNVRVVRPLERLADAAGQLGELLQILTRAEAAAGAGDDDCAHLRVGCFLECSSESAVKRTVERVEDLGPVEPDREHCSSSVGKHLVRQRQFPFPTDESAHRILRLVAEHREREPVAGVADGLVPREVAPYVELLLRVARRLRKLRCELLDQLVDGRVQLRFGNSPVHEPPLGCLHSRNLVAQKHDLPRPPVSDHELQPLGSAARGHRAVLEADVPDERRVDHHREVAGHLQLVAAADRDPVDPGDRRLADLAHPVVGVLEGAEPLPVLLRASRGSPRPRNGGRRRRRMRARCR